jgi:AmmeMemoRadiSam system protein A
MNPQHTPATDAFDAAEGRQLLALARCALEESVRHDRLPEPNPGMFPPSFALPRGCFVTLTKGGELRGCIGNILPRLPLYQAVLENARGAAFDDSRFDCVQPAELDELKIEISVLGERRALSFTSPDDLLKQLLPNEHGVILRVRGQTATFLPQVWAKLPDKTTFLNHLSQKAGCPPGAWREPGTTVEVYSVERFDETGPD